MLEPCAAEQNSCWDYPIIAATPSAAAADDRPNGRNGEPGLFRHPAGHRSGRIDVRYHPHGTVRTKKMVGDKICCLFHHAGNYAR